jgi:hypothetical protein
MEMLMAVKMGESQSCLLKTGELRRDLSFDLTPVDASEEGAFEKFTTRAGKPSRFINESRQQLGVQDGSLFYQRQMQANIQVRILASQRDGILECTSRHKQGGARYDSVLKSL